ncbi:MAG: S1C family serine protease [Hyphomicrobiaceae bacterium]
MTGGDPTSFWRRIAILALVLLAIVSAERTLTRLLFSATNPRAVAPRPDLAPAERGAADIYRAVSPSVAYIFSRRGGENVEGASGAGSGFVWDRAGRVVTNNHVVEGTTEVGVVLGEGSAIPARIVGRAPWVDLAVLELSTVPVDLVPIAIGRSGALVVGQTVLAIGNPFGLQRTLTQGIISALDRRLPTPGGREIAGVIQTDAAINPGNSGGPLVDSAGRLIGVNTAIIAPTGAFAGIGFAVPVDTVNRLVPEIIAKGRAALPGIGIQALPEEVAVRIGVSGVVVQAVVPGSSAAAAGLRGVDSAGRLGDVIVGIDGANVRNLADLAAGLERAGIGNTAQLRVRRASTTLAVEVRVQDING